MHAGRATSLARVLRLLAVFLVASVVMGTLAAGLALPGVGGLGAATRSSVTLFDSLPSQFTASPLAQQSKMLDVKGNVIATPYEVNRVVVPLSAVAPVMREAQVAIEDSRFYAHGDITRRTGIGVVDCRRLLRLARQRKPDEDQGGTPLAG